MALRRYASRQDFPLSQSAAAGQIPPLKKSKGETAGGGLRIGKEKLCNMVLALKDMLMEDREHVISFGELGALRKRVGVGDARRFARVIHGHPAFFEIYKEQDELLWCGPSKKAEELITHEMKLHKSYEPLAVQKLRKLLMMAVNNRLQVAKLALLRRDIGLPVDFRKRLIYDYPQFFQVAVETEGLVLELKAWDPSLAVTTLEIELAAGSLFRNLNYSSSPVRTTTPIVLQPANMGQLQVTPLVSPYRNAANDTFSRTELEKRTIILLHEILSMTHEKTALLEQFAHFCAEFKLPHNVLNLFLEHRQIFSVSRKKHGFVVFLKKAYNEGTLIDKNDWVLLKELYYDLISLDNCTKKVVEES